jgi:hypothetical protein
MEVKVSDLAASIDEIKWKLLQTKGGHGPNS